MIKPSACPQCFKDRTKDEIFKSTVRLDACIASSHQSQALWSELF